MKYPPKERGSLLLLVVVLVATLSVAIPYMFQATTQMSRMVGKMRAKFVSESLGISAIDFVEILFQNEQLIVEVASPWRVKLNGLVPAPSAFWEFTEGGAATPSVLTFYACDPRGIKLHGPLPSEDDCIAELSGYVTTIRFQALSPTCDHVIAQVETVNAGAVREIERSSSVVSFPTGLIC